MVIVVGELRRVEQGRPVVLLVIAEHADVGFHPLIVVFDLSLCLRVIGRGESLVDIERFEEASSVIGGEQGTPICIVDPGYSVVFPHVS